MKIIKDFINDSFSVDMIVYVPNSDGTDDFDTCFEIRIDDHHMEFTETELNRFIKDLNFLKRVYKTGKLK